MKHRTTFPIGSRRRGTRIALGLLLSVPAAGWLASAHAAGDTGDASVDEIVVTAKRGTTVVKNATPVLETPQNIQVLSSRLLKDQGVSILEDALRNVAGVMPAPYARGYDFYKIRGFDASGFTYVDGLPRGVALNIEPAALDRVEVLKGPSSVLFGQGPPGGLVNLVSKRPRPESFLNAEVSTASWGGYMPYLDFGGSFNSSESVYGRLVTLYRHEGSYLDFNPGIRRLYVAPSLTWEMGPGSSLTVLTSLSRERNELIPDQPASGLILPNPNGKFSRDLYIGDPENPGKIHQDWYTGGYELRHAIGERATFYQNARISYLDLLYLNLYQPAGLSADGRTQSEYGQDYSEKRRRYSVDSGVNLDFATGAVRHRVNVGLEYEGSRDDFAGGLGFSPTIDFDLFDPDYSVFVHQPRTVTFAGGTRSKAFGLYAQEELKPTERLALTAGARYDEVKINDEKHHAFVPRLGMSYRIRPDLVGYLSYAKSFNPQAGYVDASGAAVRPERGEQYEAGVKLGSQDGRLSSTVSLFHLLRSNVVNQIPGSFAYQTSGEQRSRGVELDGQFRLTSALEMVASYSYTDVEVTEDTVVPEGSWVTGMPRHKASLWMRYVIPDGGLKGLGFSAGGSLYSKQAGDGLNSYFIDSYQLVNMNVSYNRGRYSVLFNVNNVLDEKYVRGALGSLFVVGGEPRNYRLTLGYSY